MQEYQLEQAQWLYSHHGIVKTGFTVVEGKIVEVQS